MVLSRMTTFCTKKALLSKSSGTCRTSFVTVTVERVLFSYFNFNCLVQRRPQVCHYCATLAFTKIYWVTPTSPNTPGWVVMFLLFFVKTLPNANDALCQKRPMIRNIPTCHYYINRLNTDQQYLFTQNSTTIFSQNVYI